MSRNVKILEICGELINSKNKKTSSLAICSFLLRFAENRKKKQNNNKFSNLKT